MKNCKFMSPLDWSHHLTQMASLHKYEPSEMGKRVEALLEKLYLPENSYCYAKFPQWFADAASRGSEEEQVRYVMNHLCPNLFHFYMVPTPSEYRLDVETVNTMLHNHMCENTQATILNEDGSIYQDGVHDTHEELSAIAPTWMFAVLAFQQLLRMLKSKPVISMQCTSGSVLRI